MARHRLAVRHRVAVVAAMVAVAAVLGCQGGPPTIFGYQLGGKALYDTNIRSVYVPVFHNRAFQTTPHRGMEVEITRAIVREIGAKTPYKVVSDPSEADTELLGNIVSIDKLILNRNQQNLIREADLVITVDVLWRDLRDGRILSTTRPPPGLTEPAPIPFDPNVPEPPPPVVAQPPLPVRLVATGRMIPELGESNTTAQQRAVDQLARQIVSMMEKPW